MEKGCITPLALIFDQKKVVEVIIDEDLMSSEYIGVHPGTNSATIGISPSDLEKYIYVNNSKEIKKMNINQFIGEEALKLEKEMKLKNQQQQPIISKKDNKKK